MVDFRQEMLSYRPFKNEKLVDEDIKLADDIKNSINLYNKALRNLWRNSEDIAIIELKKAVSMNPEFHEAINLLGICYAYTKNYSEALDAFMTVEKITGKNEKTSLYKNAIMELVNEDSRPTKRESEKSVFVDNKSTKIKKNESTKSIIEKKDKKFSGSKEKDPVQKQVILNLNSSKSKYNFTLHSNSKSRFLIIAIILAAALAVFALQLATGSIIPFKNIISSWMNDGTKEKEEDMKVSLADFKSLENDFNQLKTEYEDANKQLEYYKNAAKLISVEKMASEGKFEEGADALAAMGKFEFNGYEKEKYDSLCSDIFPRAALDVYNSGCDYYNREMYKEALEKLLKIEAYGNNWNYLNWTMYQIAMCYKELGQKDNAIKVFEDITVRFHGSEYEQYARNWIAQLQAQ